MKRSAIILLLLLASSVAAEDLRQVFATPPQQAKPRGYWIWPHGNFDYAAIKHELAEFAAKGLGGVDIFDLGVRDKNDVIPAGPAFMSAEQVDGLVFAFQEAQKYGLKMGLIVSSSWNAGGSWTPPASALMNLVAHADTVMGPMFYDRPVPFPVVPRSFKKPYGTFDLFPPMDQNGMPEFYQDAAMLVYPLRPDGTLADAADVQVLPAGGSARIDIPAGRWVILRAVCTNFGQRLWLPSRHSQGLIIDHFSKEATRAHFQTILDRLQARAGSLQNTALERLYLASYESDVPVIWTPTFADEFRARNNYRIEPYLPALFGTVIVDKETTERFLYDYRKTASDLFVENFYRAAREICHENGLLICSEAGGPGPPLHNVPTEDLKALGSVDVMRGEFWNRGPSHVDDLGLNLMQVVKSIASAAHTYDHKVVEMEAFTSFLHWQEGPAAFKPMADRAFCEGMNRVVYHTMTHNVPEAGAPGWTYQAGTHMNTNLTWWHLSDQLHAYLARCSALLQQGRFVADACFYYGHAIPNFARPKHVRPTLGTGYDYDDLNTEMLLTARVRNGRVELKGGMTYEVLVLPDDERMDLKVLQKISELIHGGAWVIGVKPKRIYGLAGYPAQEAELKKLADALWGRKVSSRLERRIGQGRLIFGWTVREVLQNKGIAPDVQVFPARAVKQVDFIHRRAGNEDIYFIRNADSTALMLEALFRVQAGRPELWDAVSGDMQTCALYAEEQQGVRLPLHLPAHGSVFVLFTDRPRQRHIRAISAAGRQLFPGKPGAATMALAAEHAGGQIRFAADAPGTYELLFSDAGRQSVEIRSGEKMSLAGAWDVRFPFGWGARTIQRFDSLYSWTEARDAGTRSFSGTATYRKTFSVPESFLGQGRRIILSLGEVKEVARVWLNGHELGIAGFAPYEVDASAALREGDNFLIVEVANTWLNRLIADDQKPLQARSTHTNLTEGPTNDKPWREVAPRPSGLLGPVTLVVHPLCSMDE